MSQEKKQQEHLKSLFVGKGLCGLQNLGNTCYLNTAVHCLSHSLPLTWYFLSDQYLEDMGEEEKEEDVLIKEWKRLLTGIWDSNCTIAPQTFIKTIHQLSQAKQRTFIGYGQNDAQELLEFMIEMMHESLSKKVTVNISGKPKNPIDYLALEAAKSWKNYFKDSYSIYVELFYGQFISQIKCSEEDCDDISYTYEPFCCCTLPIPATPHFLTRRDPGPITLEECFGTFCKTELLDGDNKWYHEKSKAFKKAYKKIMFWKTPNILIVCLKRFEDMGPKNNTPVAYPVSELDLTKYCVGYDRNESKYRLVAVGNHIGSEHFGHYFAHCRNQNGKWYKFDDAHVTQLDPSEIVSPYAYLLLYQKTK